MSPGRNYMFGENAITKCGGSPIGYRVLDVRDINCQSRSMQFTLWDDLICYMIEKKQAWFWMESGLQESKPRCTSSSLTNANNYYKIFEFPLVHLGYTYYRHL